MTPVEISMRDYEHLFPEEAVFVHRHVAHGRVDMSAYHQLHPLEKALVARAVDGRKAEFGDARACAHEALEQLDAPDTPILRDAAGAPIWPEGYCGSLTHTNGFRAALVARQGSIRSLGIDVEPAESASDDILATIARPAEITQVAQLRSQGIPFADRLLFCAKEATYKAWFPITHRWLGFEQAEIDIRIDGTFIAYLLTRPTPVPFINGRWAVRDGYIIAATCIREH